ncbi:MAG: hypothetical protein RJB38_11 [Pseudomonadota bacterium]
MTKTLIAITQRADDLEFVTKVAQTAQLTVKQPADMDAAMALIDSEDAPVLFIDASAAADYSRFESAIQEKFGLFSSKIAANRIHFLSSDDIDRVPHLMASPIFGSYLRRNYTQAAGVGERYGRIIRASLLERAFGIDQLIKPGTRIQTIKLTNSKQKQEAVEVVRNYLVALKFQSRMATLIANSVDELLMNAIYDAPTDATGKHIYVSTPRNTEFELKDKASVELHVAFDGEVVALTAVDLFGSLEKAKLLGAISKIYREQEYRVRATVAGAGIGLATVFQTGGSFHFASDHGARTEVTVFFRKTENFKEFKNQFRFISTQFYF